MFNKHFIILFILFFALSLNSYSQPVNIDSLLNTLKNVKDHNEKSEILLNLSEKYRKDRLFQKSNYYAEKGIKLPNINFKNKAILLLITAKNYYSVSNFNKSIHFYKLLLREAKINNNDFFKGQCFSGLSKNYWRTGKLNEAAILGIKAIKIFEKINDKENLKAVKINLAIIYLDLKNFKKADLIYDSFLENKENYKDTSFLANLYEKKGVIKFYQSFYPFARKYYKQSFFLSKSINDELSAAVETGNIAETYEMEGNYSKALKLYKEALITEEKNEYYTGIIFLYEATGRTYKKMKQYRKSAQYYKKAMKLIEKTEEFRELPNIYEMLHRLYAKTGDYKKAYEYSLKLSSVKDTLIGKDVQNKINDLNIKYETQKTEAENKILKIKQLNQQKENKKQYLIIVTISVLLLFIILFLILLVNSNSKNKKIKHILSLKNDQLNEAYSNIKGSIDYAGKIQNAMLKSYLEYLKTFPEFIILYKPAFTLSGDFYWSKKINDTIFVAVADSTGHGIPGALLSITGMSFLNEIVTEDYIKPGIILNNLRNKIKHRLNQKGNFYEQKDGWDMALFSYNYVNNTAFFSGAFNSLYVITEKNDTKIIKKYPADRQPVGVFIKEEPFKSHKLNVKKGNIIWMFTDGFTDQFSEKDHKKFSSKRLKELLLKISEKSMSEQKNILNEAFKQWKGNFEQIDDILITGIKI